MVAFTYTPNSRTKTKILDGMGCRKQNFGDSPIYATQGTGRRLLSVLIHYLPERLGAKSRKAALLDSDSGRCTERKRP